MKIRIMKSVKKHPPPTRVSKRLLARSASASAGRQSQANEKAIQSIIVTAVAKENKEVLDEQTVPQESPPPPKTTAPGVPNTTLQTAPICSHQ